MLSAYLHVSICAVLRSLSSDFCLPWLAVILMKAADLCLRHASLSRRSMRRRKPCATAGPPWLAVILMKAADLQLPSPCSDLPAPRSHQNATRFSFSLPNFLVAPKPWQRRINLSFALSLSASQIFKFAFSTSIADNEPAPLCR